MPAKGKDGRGKGKKASITKAILPSLSSDDDHDDHDEHNKHDEHDVSIKPLIAVVTSADITSTPTNQIKSNQHLFIVGITYNEISLYSIIHLNNK